MITRTSEAKTLIKLISCGSKSKFKSTACNSNKKCNIINVNMCVEGIVSGKQNIVKILADVFVRIVGA